MQIENKDLIGFVMTDHMKKEGYETGKHITAKILDIDKERKLLDLSHSNHFFELSKTSSKSQLTICQHKNLIPSLLPYITKFNKAKSLRARVELVKESYAVVSMLEHPYALALIPIQLFNRDEKEVQINKLSIGHTLSIRLVKFLDNHQVFLGVPSLTNLRRIWDTEDNGALTVKFSELELDPATLEVGQKINGKVNSVQGYVAFIHFNKKVYGRLHKAQCGSEQKFSELHKGVLITVYIIKIEKNKEKEAYKLDLTLDPDVKATQFKVGDKCIAVIKNIQWNNSYPLLLELSANTRAFVHFKDIVSDPHKLEVIREKLKEGMLIMCYPLFDLDKSSANTEKLRASLYSLEEVKSKIEIGRLVVCRYITSKEGCGVSVQLDDKLNGVIDITELSDEFEAKPFNELKKKGVFAARILEVITDNKKNEERIVLTARKSLLDEKLWKAIKSDSTAKFQQFDYINEKGDLRTKIIKLGTEWLQPGMLGLGYVSNINDKGCFIKASYKLTVRASLRELTDAEIVNPVAIYKQNDLVLFRITSIVESQKGQELYKQKHINVSLRESIVKYGLSVTLKDIKVGQQCQAIVRRKESDVQSWTQIKGSSLLAIVKNLPAEVMEGELINCTVQKVETAEENKRIKIKLKYEGKVDTISEPNEVEELYQKIMGAYKVVQPETMQDVGSDEDLVLNPEDLEEEGENVIQEVMQDESDSDNQNEQEMKNDSEDSENIEQNHSDNNEDNNEINSKEENVLEHDSNEYNNIVIEDNKSVEDKENNNEDAKAEENTSKKQMPTHLKEKIREEKNLRKLEKFNLSDNQPQSIEDFEKAVLTTPNSSFIWLQYATFMLDNACTASVRRIFERAIKTVAPTEEQNKLNLWIGYLNLESIYGDTESLQKVAQRAIEVNDRKKIYNALAKIYFSSKRYELALDVYKLMTKKYHDDVSIWAQYTDFLFKLMKIKTDKEHEDYKKVIVLDFLTPREVLPRSLQALDRKKSVEMIVKYGQQEYKYGNMENGRTMFEGVVSSHPNRTDIWSVYLDMEIKYGNNTNKDYIRGLFERCLKLKLKDEKMKFFFKKYLNYELSYGSTSTVEYVKEKANEYVQSLH